MEKIALIPNVLRDIGLEESKKLVQFLLERNKIILMEDRFQNESLPNVCFCSMDTMMQEAELAVVLGGDGTILDIAPQAAHWSIRSTGWIWCGWVCCPWVCPIQMKALRNAA